MIQSQELPAPRCAWASQQGAPEPSAWLQGQEEGTKQDACSGAWAQHGSTYFRQEWHSPSPGWPPQASRLAGPAPRRAGSPRASHSRQTAAPSLASVIQALFPAWNEEKEWKSAVCSLQRRRWSVICEELQVHAKPHACITVVWAAMLPKDQFAQYLSFLFTRGAAETSRRDSSIHSEHASPCIPPSPIRVIAMEICYSNTEKLELPSGGEDLKGPQCCGWSLLFSSASTPSKATSSPQWTPDAADHIRDSWAMFGLAAFVLEGSVLNHAAPILCFNCKLLKVRFCSQRLQIRRKLRSLLGRKKMQWLLVVSQAALCRRSKCCSQSLKPS